MVGGGLTIRRRATHCPSEADIDPTQDRFVVVVFVLLTTGTAPPVVTVIRGCSTSRVWITSGRSNRTPLADGVASSKARSRCPRPPPMSAIVAKREKS
jgi:hypothetical protein